MNYQRFFEDSHNQPQACPDCPEAFNVFQVTGEREITGDGQYEDVLWQCDSCGTRWFVRVAVDEES